MLALSSGLLAAVSPKSRRRLSASDAQSGRRDGRLFQRPPEQTPANALVTNYNLIEMEVIHDPFENRRTRENYVGASWLKSGQFLALRQRQGAEFRDRGHHVVVREMMPMHDLRIVSGESKRHRANRRNRPRQLKRLRNALHY